MIPVIKILVITLTIMVVTPIRVSLRKGLHVLRMLLIPGIPPRLIPVSRSDNIGGRISIIRSPSILVAVKIIQQSIIKPISLIKNPRCVGPNPWYPVRILGWGCLVSAPIIRA
jgi:hypothetical protein